MAEEKKNNKDLGVVDPQCTALEERERKTTLGPLFSSVDSQREAPFNIASSIFAI